MTINQIPIIIVHTGDSIYLKYSLQQARYYNPNTPIYLIGNEANNKYPFITHVNIQEYTKSAQEFSKHYVHMSFTNQKFEEFCFSRWFIAKDFVERNNIDQFICLDSDVLLFCNSKEVHEKFKHFSFTIRNKYGMGFNYFSSKKAISDFCRFISDYYTNPDLFHILELNWEGYQKMKSGGVCDMLLVLLYGQQNPEKLADCGIIENQTIYEYILLDLVTNNEKIRFKKSIPYLLKKETGSWIRLKALHVNVDKDKIYRYYTGGGLYKERFKDWFRDMRDKYQLRTRIKKLLQI